MRLVFLLAFLSLTLAAGFQRLAHFARVKKLSLNQLDDPLVTTDTESEDGPIPSPEVREKMKEVIETQFKVGKSVVFGVFQQEPDLDKAGTEKERKAKRDLAAQKLVNIDDTERNRRKLIGQATAVLTSVIYGATFYFHAGIVARAASIYLPLAFSVGFYESGKKGL